MTEYTTSSDAIREYLTARERTAYWVNQHFTRVPENDLLSPSVPPSELDDSDAPSYGPSDSDNESSHSLPPRMVLRWNDGRPDLPIAPDQQNSFHRPQSARPSGDRRRNASLGSGAHAPPPPSIPRHGSAGPHPRYEQSLSYVTAPGEEGPLEGPENIVVLPSPQEGDPGQAPMSVGGGPSHVSHLESRPMPSRTATMHSARRPQMNGMFGPSETQRPSRHPSIAAPRPRHAYNSSQGSRHGAPSPSMAYSQSQPSQAQREGRSMEERASSRVASQLPYAYSPPAIIYAPSSRHGSSYAPPAIVYSPPSHINHSHNRGAPSITYSHSAPLPHGHRPGTRGSHHPSHRGAPSNLPLDEEAEQYDGTQGRSRSRVRAMSETQALPRHGTNSERSRTRGMYAVPRSPYRPQSRPRSPLREDGSDTSGSTYYILPTPGQKVQIIVSCTTFGVNLIFADGQISHPAPHLSTRPRPLPKVDSSRRTRRTRLRVIRSHSSSAYSAYPSSPVPSTLEGLQGSCRDGMPRRSPSRSSQSRKALPLLPLSKVVIAATMLLARRLCISITSFPPLIYFRGFHLHESSPAHGPRREINSRHSNQVMQEHANF